MLNRIPMLMCFAIVGSVCFCETTVAQHQCGSHSSDWHKHDDDGYWQKWWKIEEWEPNYVSDHEEEIESDAWEDIIDRIQITNSDCDGLAVTIEREASFEHKVEIVWGGEIHATAQAFVRAFFTKIKGEVGAKVDWHRSGTNTRTERFNIRQQKSLSACKYIEFYYQVREIRKKYSFKFATARFWCRDHHTRNWDGWYVCNQRLIRANGVGYLEQRTGWENSRKICECDNGVAVPLDDGTDQSNDGSGR